MVNRIWHYHFGQGIVGSPSDFGIMGERPSNPQLLDYLASVFVENGWSIKSMHRMIMLSNAYQQSSAYQETAAKVDPDDKLVWRFARRRLEGEVIRDSMLFAGNQLNLKMGGPGVFPPLPPGVSMPRSSYLNWKTEKDEAESNRRSVYIFVKRNLRYPMFETFDFPDTHEPCPRRYATVTPTQPLALMNDELVMEWSRALASRVLNDSGLSAEQQIERTYRLLLSRAPKPEESKSILDFLNEQSVVARRAAGEGRQGSDARRRPARHASGSRGSVRGPLPYAAELQRVHLHELDGRNAIMIGNLQDSHYRRAATRRDFFTRAGSGLAGVALAQMLQEDALRAATSAGRSDGSEEAGSSADGQVHHLALHGRRPEPCRSVRP